MTSAENAVFKTQTQFISSSFKVCKLFSSFLYSIYLVPYKLCIDKEKGKVYFSRTNRFHAVSLFITFQSIYVVEDA